MFTDKFSRYFRSYMLSLIPRKPSVRPLPLKANANTATIEDALQRYIDAEQALEAQEGGDVIELMKVRYRNDSLVLLFHRISPSTADPMYRKKAREAAGVKVTLRQSTREKDEEPAVSAHLVIYDKPTKPGVYKCILEEIPGLSMGLIRRIIGKALFDYKFEVEKNKKIIETYTVLRATGVRSESLTEALKTGVLGHVTLSRQAKKRYVDGDFEGVTETMKLRIKREITADDWRDKFAKLVEAGKKDGWTDFDVDLMLDDDRRKTIDISGADDRRQAEAGEILFVRSERVAFKKELLPCSAEIHAETVEHALAILQAEA